MTSVKASCSTVSCCVNVEIECQGTTRRSGHQITKLEPSLLLPSLSALSLNGGQEQQQETESPTNFGRVRPSTNTLSTTTNQAEKSSNNKTLQKQVSFGSVTIRQFPIIIGNHPDTREGPPVSTN